MSFSARKIRSLFHAVHARCWPIGLALLGMAGPLANAQPADLDEGWSLLANYLYRDAGKVFDTASNADQRLLDLGKAASLLNESPVTAGKIAKAEELLQRVGSHETVDTASLYARYLTARILHMHRQATVSQIEAAYREVIAAGPETAVAQLAAGHLALVLLYQRMDLTVPQRLAAAQSLESAGAGKALPDVAVSFYRALADASLFYEQLAPQVLVWLEQAHAIGSSDSLTQNGLSLRIAEIARGFGQKDKAIVYYREFLATAVPTDQRYATAKLRMNELEGMTP